MKKNISRSIFTLFFVSLYACVSNPPTGDKRVEGSVAPQNYVPTSAIQGSVFGPAQEFVGSPYEAKGNL